MRLDLCPRSAWGFDELYYLSSLKLLHAHHGPFYRALGFFFEIKSNNLFLSIKKGKRSKTNLLLTNSQILQDLGKAFRTNE